MGRVSSGTVVGIETETPGYKITSVKPYFFEKLDWAKGSIAIPAGGTLAVEWRREAGGVRVVLEVPAGVTARFGDRLLTEGTYAFTV